MAEKVIQELRIPGPMPGLNDLIGHGKFGFMRAAGLKKKWHQTIALVAKAQSFRPVLGGVFMYSITEPNRRRDPSNFCCAAIKLIEDGLQQAGLLRGDGWDAIELIRLHWDYGPHPEVRVLVNGTLWEEGQNEREEKGKNKFRRAIAGHRGLPKVARKTVGPGAASSRARIPKRGNSK